MYPKLTSIEQENGACVFVLDDGTRVPLNFSRGDFAEFMDRLGYPPLDELCDKYKFDVVHGPVQMSVGTWQQISKALRGNRAFMEAIEPCDDLKAIVEMSHEELTRLPFGLYGAIHPVEHFRDVLYTNARCDFRPCDRKGKGWFMGQLASTGGRLLQIDVNPKSGKVEFQKIHAPGHYVEPGVEPMTLRLHANREDT